MSDKPDDQSVSTPADPLTDRLMRLPEVLTLIPVAKSTWWKWVAEGNAPSPVHIGPRCSGWRSSEIRRLMEGRNKGGKP
jgi:prophage regulatory protein